MFFFLLLPLYWKFIWMSSYYMVTLILRQTINFIFYWQFKDLPLLQMTCNDIMMSVIACYEECAEQTVTSLRSLHTYTYILVRIAYTYAPLLPLYKCIVLSRVFSNKNGVLLQLHSSIEFIFQIRNFLENHILFMIHNIKHWILLFRVHKATCIDSIYITFRIRTNRCVFGI